MSSSMSQPMSSSSSSYSSAASSPSSSSFSYSSAVSAQRVVSATLGDRPSSAASAQQVVTASLAQRPFVSAEMQLGSDAPFGAEERPADGGEVTVGLAYGSRQQFRHVCQLKNDTKSKVHRTFQRLKQVIINEIATQAQQAGRDMDELQIEQIKVEVDVTNHIAHYWVDGEDQMHKMDLMSDQLSEHSRNAIRGHLQEIFIDAKDHRPLGVNRLESFKSNYMGTTSQANVFQGLDSVSGRALSSDFETFAANDLLKALDIDPQSNEAIDRSRVVYLMRRMATQELYKKHMMKNLYKMHSERVEALRNPARPLAPQEKSELERDIKELAKLYQEFRDVDLFALFSYDVYHKVVNDENPNDTHIQKATRIADKVMNHMQGVSRVNKRSLLGKISKKLRGPAANETARHKAQEEYAKRVGGLYFEDRVRYHEYTLQQGLKFDGNTGIAGRFILINSVNRSLPDDNVRKKADGEFHYSGIFDGLSQGAQQEVLGRMGHAQASVHEIDEQIASHVGVENRAVSEIIGSSVGLVQNVNDLSDQGNGYKALTSEELNQWVQD